MCDMREVGRDEGRAEEKIEMIRTMNADGISLEKALQYAGIDFDTYKRLESEYALNQDR